MRGEEGGSTRQEEERKNEGGVLCVGVEGGVKEQKTERRGKREECSRFVSWSVKKGRM